MGGELLVTGGDSSAFLEPADASFDDVAATVFPTVHPLARLISLRGDDGFDASAGEPPPDSRDAVRSISGNCVRASSPSDSNRIHEEFEVLRLVSLPCGDQSTKWHATPVGHKMKLRAKASAGSPQGVVDWLILSFFFDAPAAAR